MDPLPFGRAHPVLHPDGRIGIGRRLRRRCPSLPERPARLLPAGSNQRLDAPVVAQFDIGAAEIPGIGDDAGRAADIVERGKRRRRLADIIRSPAEMGMGGCHGPPMPGRPRPARSRRMTA